MPARQETHLLVVDDEPFVRNALQLYLETHGYHVATAYSGERAIEVLEQASHDFDVILLDLVMPGIHGIEVLQRVKEIQPLAEVVIATGCGSVHSAVEAMRFGAFDYITKPIVNFEDDLLRVIRTAIAARADKVRASQAAAASRPETSSTGDDPLDVFSHLEKMAFAYATNVTRQEFARLFDELVSRYLAADRALVLRKHVDGTLETVFSHGNPPAQRNTEVQALAHARLWDDGAERQNTWSTLYLGPPAVAALYRPRQGGPTVGGKVETLVLPLVGEIQPGGIQPRQGDGKQTEENTDDLRLFLLRQPTGMDVPHQPVPAGLLRLIVGAAFASGILTRSVPALSR